MTSRRVMKDFGSPETRQRVFSSASLRELSHRPTSIEVPGQRGRRAMLGVGLRALRRRSTRCSSSG
jgi:site-specific DNA-cytosine methylase